MDRFPLAVEYAEALASDGVVRGLIGPRETPRLWERHLLNSAVLAEEIPQAASVADVGSGAGLPGIPLAIARADLAVTLIEPLLRRATFLNETVERLGLSNVSVIRARGEDLHQMDDLRPGFDVVTSRAVSSFSRLLDWCMPLVGPHGSMLAIKGASAPDEVADASTSLGSWGCGTPSVIPLGTGVLADPTYAIRVSWADPASVTWPARRRSAKTRSERAGRSAGRGRRR